MVRTEEHLELIETCGTCLEIKGKLVYYKHSNQWNHFNLTSSHDKCVKSKNRIFTPSEFEEYKKQWNQEQEFKNLRNNPGKKRKSALSLDSNWEFIDNITLDDQLTTQNNNENLDTIFIEHPSYKEFSEITGGLRPGELTHSS